jgi:hypothetical protein
MATAKQFVLGRYSQAYCNSVPNTRKNWSIYTGETGGFLSGSGKSESNAWVEAKKKIIELEEGTNDRNKND